MDTNHHSVTHNRASSVVVRHVWRFQGSSQNPQIGGHSMTKNVRQKTTHITEDWVTRAPQQTGKQFWVLISNFIHNKINLRGTDDFVIYIIIVLWKDSVQVLNFPSCTYRSSVKAKRLQWTTNWKHKSCLHNISWRIKWYQSILWHGHWRRELDGTY